jgi:outer membrane protein TolC
LLVFYGCYSYPPLPEAVNSKEYKNIDRKIHRALPEDSKIITLETAIEIALANNPDYRSAKHAVAGAWARFYSACSAYFPTLSANYEITEYKYVPLSSGGTGRDQGGQRYSNKTGALQAEWELFDGLVTSMTVISARKEASQYEALDKDARRLLIMNVVNAYNNVLLARENIKIAQENLKFNEDLLRETEIKYKAGAVPLSEPLNFKVKANQAKSVLTDQTYDYITATFVLAELMGFTTAKIPDNTEFSPVKRDKSKFIAGEIETYLDTALANRPDLEAYRKALEAEKYYLWSRYGAFLPTISANGSWGYSRNDSGYSGRYQYRPRTQDRSFNYGLSADWIIFSGGSRIADLREAQASVAEAQEGLTGQWIKVVAQVRQSLENCKRAQTQTTIYEETLKLVLQTRDLVEEEYKAGNTSITRLNEAQTDLVNAESNFISSLIDLENAIVQLNAATGSL